MNMKCHECMNAWYKLLPKETRKNPQMLAAAFQAQKNQISDAVTIYNFAMCLAHWKKLTQW